MLETETIKTIKTRVSQKHDTAENWANSDLIPLEGELIIYDADENSPARIKLGDGKSSASELPFLDDSISAKVFEDLANNGQISDQIAEQISEAIAEIPVSKIKADNHLNMNGYQIFNAAEIAFSGANGGDAYFRMNKNGSNWMEFLNLKGGLRIRTTGQVDFSGYSADGTTILSSIHTPTHSTHAANKQYVDDKIDSNKQYVDDKVANLEAVDVNLAERVSTVENEVNNAFLVDLNFTKNEKNVVSRKLRINKPISTDVSAFGWKIKVAFYTGPGENDPTIQNSPLLDSLNLLVKLAVQSALNLYAQKSYNSIQAATDQFYTKVNELSSKYSELDEFVKSAKNLYWQLTILDDNNKEVNLEDVKSKFKYWDNIPYEGLLDQAFKDLNEPTLNLQNKQILNVREIQLIAPDDVGGTDMGVAYFRMNKGGNPDKNVELINLEGGLEVMTTGQVKFTTPNGYADNTRLIGVASPKYDNEAANKKYVDDTVGAIKNTLDNTYTDFTSRITQIEDGIIDTTKTSIQGKSGYTTGVQIRNVSTTPHNITIEYGINNAHTSIPVKNSSGEIVSYVGGNETFYINGYTYTFNSTEIPQDHYAEVYVEDNDVPVTVTYSRALTTTVKNIKEELTTTQELLNQRVDELVTLIAAGKLNTRYISYIGTDNGRSESAPASVTFEEGFNPSIVILTGGPTTITMIKEDDGIVSEATLEPNRISLRYKFQNNVVTWWVIKHVEINNQNEPYYAHDTLGKEYNAIGIGDEYTELAERIENVEEQLADIDTVLVDIGELQNQISTLETLTENKVSNEDLQELKDALDAIIAIQENLIGGQTE